METAGYSGTPLIKKLGVKEGFRIGLVEAPKTFMKTLSKLPEKAKVISNLTPPLDVILVFVKAERALRTKFPILAEKLTANGMIWVAWPKKSSGVVTDLSFDVVQHIGLDCGLVDVKICAIDETWSGLKFVYRVRDRARRASKST
jgi:hypothetical protein